MNFKEHLIAEEKQILAEFISFCEENNLEVCMESITLYNEFLSKIGQGTRRALVGATLPFLMWQTGTAQAQKMPSRPGQSNKPAAGMVAKNQEITSVKKLESALKNWNNVNHYTMLVTKDKEIDLGKVGTHSKGLPYKIIYHGASGQSYHQNAFGVKTDFDFKNIKRMQDNNPDWRYVPALNKFVSMKDLQDSDSPLEAHLHDSFDGQQQGTVGEFFGLKPHELEQLFQQGAVPLQKAPKLQTVPDSPLHGLPRTETDPNKIPAAPKEYKPNVY